MGRVGFLFSGLCLCGGERWFEATESNIPFRSGRRAGLIFGCGLPYTCTMRLAQEEVEEGMVLHVILSCPQSATLDVEDRGCRKPRHQQLPARALPSPTYVHVGSNSGQIDFSHTISIAMGMVDYPRLHLQRVLSTEFVYYTQYAHNPPPPHPQIIYL
jgi:hypothetical protein